MKDSIIRWVAAFGLVAVIAVAAIFAVDDGEVASEAIEERFQALENKTSNVDENHSLFKEGDHLDRKSEFKKEKFKDQSDLRNEVKEKKFRGKLDRFEHDEKSKKGKPSMSKPLPPMLDEMGGGHRDSLDRHMPPMMGRGFMPPMMGEGFMPPMMGEGFEIRESEIFKEIEQIFNAILASIESIDELDSADSKTADDGNFQSSELTLSLIEELIKETFDQRFEEEIAEIVDRVAKEAITQIIEGLIQESDEQTLEGTTESN